MRLLLDTHALLWILGEPHRVPERVRNLYVDPLNDVAVSAASAWEIAIKQSLGKLELPAPAETWLPAEVERAGMSFIDVTAQDALRVRSLPWHHRDPFDRLLVAQAMGGYTLVTHDTRMKPYGVPVLWE
jgi:PIN domain nuclease of toxin-antitoxin system